MRRLLAQMQKDFLARTTAPRVLGAIAVRFPRLVLAALLAAIPGLLIFLAAWLGPAELTQAMTRTQNVHDTFARFVSGIATASSIAVSVAALTLRRDLRGIGSHEERHETNEAYRARVRRRLQADDLPVEMGPFLAETLEGIAARAREAQAACRAEGTRSDDELEDYLSCIERRATVTAEKVREAADEPDRLLLAALDFEHEVTARLAHRFARASSRGGPQLEELCGLLGDFILAQKFLKTLDTQYGLSRMSGAILLSTLPSLVVASLMVLTYGDGAVDALGLLGAAGLVCAAFAVVLFPLACFVSYVLRFLFLNQHTLPTDGFLLGPESNGLEERRGKRGVRSST